MQISNSMNHYSVFHDNQLRSSFSINLPILNSHKWLYLINRQFVLKFESRKLADPNPINLLRVANRQKTRHQTLIKPNSGIHFKHLSSSKTHQGDTVRHLRGNDWFLFMLRTLRGVLVNCLIRKGIRRTTCMFRMSQPTVQQSIRCYQRWEEVKWTYSVNNNKGRRELTIWELLNIP